VFDAPEGQRCILSESKAKKCKMSMLKQLQKFLLACGSILLASVIASPMYSWRVQRMHQTEWLRHGKAEAEKKEQEKQAFLKHLDDVVHGRDKI
jgi:hypothetical protein